MSDFVERLDKALNDAAQTARLRLEFTRNEALNYMSEKDKLCTLNIHVLAYRALKKLESEQLMDPCSVPAEFENFILTVCELLGMQREKEM